MQIPTTLKHKPVIVADNYQNIDGRLAYNSDTKGLSLGLAQWNDRGNIDISAKIWRHTGDKWSRQSEEMPLHRAIDLVILICRAKEYCAEAYRYPDFLPPSENGLIDRIGLQGDAMNIAACLDNEQIKGDIKLFMDALARDDELLSERLRVLSDILKNMGY